MWTMNDNNTDHGDCDSGENGDTDVKKDDITAAVKLDSNNEGMAVPRHKYPSREIWHFGTQPCVMPAPSTPNGGLTMGHQT